MLFYKQMKKERKNESNKRKKAKERNGKNYACDIIHKILYVCIRNEKICMTNSTCLHKPNSFHNLL